MDKMIYLGYYTTPDNIEQRNYQPAACTKMTYIAETLHEIGYRVEIVSRSNTRLDRSFPASIETLAQGIALRQFRTIGGSTLIKRMLNRSVMDLSLFLYLLKQPSGSNLLVYHSLAYARMVSFLQKLKHFHLILEVEEIYADVLENDKIRKQELEFFKCADAFLFPTALLDQLVNVCHKPSVIIHGTYQAEPKQVHKADYRKMHGWDENRIHVVYAGTLDPRKGGAMAAAAAAGYLPDKYHVHILGFGTEEDKEKMRAFVSEVSKKTECYVTYDGLLSGNEYLQFIQSCDIGLSTQDPKAKFNRTSFPSKILSYMANGLRVVSISIPAIRESAVGKYMYYYDDQTPEKIAKAVMDIDKTDSYDGRRIVTELSKLFALEIKKLI